MVIAAQKQKSIVYMTRRIAMCPYDSKDLAVHGGTSGFFLFCPGCFREWPYPEGKTGDSRKAGPRSPNQGKMT